MASQLLPAGKGRDISGVGGSFPWAGLEGGAGFPWGFGQLQDGSTCAGSHRFPALLVALGTQQDHAQRGILQRCHRLGGAGCETWHTHLWGSQLPLVPPARSCSQWNNPQLQSRSDGHEPNHGNFHLNPWRVAELWHSCPGRLWGLHIRIPISKCVPVSPAPGVPALGSPELPAQPCPASVDPRALPPWIRVAHVCNPAALEIVADRAGGAHRASPASLLPWCPRCRRYQGEIEAEFAPWGFDNHHQTTPASLLWLPACW